MAEKPCDKWKQFFRDLEAELGAAVPAPQPVAELPVGMRLAQLDDNQADAAILVKQICDCFRQTMQKVTEASARPEVMRGLTTLTERVVTLNVGVVTQILDLNVNRVNWLIGNSTENMLFATMRETLVAGTGVLGGASALFLQSDVKTFGAFTQSTWFAVNIGAAPASLMVAEEVYADAIGAKPIYSILPSDANAYSATQLIQPLPPELIAALNSTDYYETVNNVDEQKWNPKDYATPQNSLLLPAQLSGLPSAQARTESPSSSPQERKIAGLARATT